MEITPARKKINEGRQLNHNQIINIGGYYDFGSIVAFIYYLCPPIIEGVRKWREGVFFVLGVENA